MKTKISEPDFLIVGAAKSGTTSLHHYLSQHPDIFMPKKYKELHFWHTYNHIEERSIINKYPFLPKTPEEYLAHFKEKKENQISGEASPAYLYYYIDTLDNLKVLKEKWQETKIIIILREPLEKIWSQFQFVRNKGLDPEELSLSNAIKKEHLRLKDFSISPSTHYINLTRYFNQVKFYQNNFNQVKVILYDDLKNNPETVLNELTDFLNVNSFQPKNIGRVYNASKQVVSGNRISKTVEGKRFLKYIPSEIKLRVKKFLEKKEIMTDRTRKELIKIFKPEVEKLNLIIDKDLSHWLKKYE